MSYILDEVSPAVRTQKGYPRLWANAIGSALIDRVSPSARTQLVHGRLWADSLGAVGCPCLGATGETVVERANRALDEYNNIIAPVNDGRKHTKAEWKAVSQGLAGLYFRYTQQELAATGIDVPTTWSVVDPNHAIILATRASIRKTQDQIDNLVAGGQTQLLLLKMQPYQFFKDVVRNVKIPKPGFDFTVVVVAVAVLAVAIAMGRGK